MSKDFDGYFLIIVIGIAAMVLFIGIVKGISGTFKASEQPSVYDSAKMQKLQKERVRKIEARQEELDRLQKQRVDDFKLQQEIQEQRLRDYQQRARDYQK